MTALVLAVVVPLAVGVPATVVAQERREATPALLISTWSGEQLMQAGATSATVRLKKEER